MTPEQNYIAIAFRAKTGETQNFVVKADAFPSQIQGTQGPLYRAESKKANPYSGYEPVISKLLGGPIQIPTAYETGIAIARYHLDPDSPQVVYSNNGDLSPEKLKERNDLVSTLRALETAIPRPQTKKCTTYNENKAVDSEINIDSGKLPSVIYAGDKEYYPMLRTNDTCCYTGGVFVKANGECSGNPGRISSSPEMVMLNNGSPSVFVYMPKDRSKELEHILDPESPLRDAVQDMYAHHRKNLIRQ